MDTTLDSVDFAQIVSRSVCEPTSSLFELLLNAEAAQNNAFNTMSIWERNAPAGFDDDPFLPETWPQPVGHSVLDDATAKEVERIMGQPFDPSQALVNIKLWLSGLALDDYAESEANIATNLLLVWRTLDQEDFIETFEPSGFDFFDWIPLTAA
jgi:hypothetical protein